MRGCETKDTLRTEVVSSFALVACVFGMLGCAGDGLDAEFTDSTANDELTARVLKNASTNEMVKRFVALPGEKVVVFDFDDTLLDHVDGASSQWASYAERAISTYLTRHQVNIAICSRNPNRNEGLNRSLRRLNPSVFNDSFFASPAFQTDSGLQKWDNIEQIMAYYGVTRSDRVLFFDDNEGNIERVTRESDVVSIRVGENGLDRKEFRDGISAFLLCAENARGGNYCSVCGDCRIRAGDCDDDSECASGLRCVSEADGGDHRQPGHDICAASTNCDGQCSIACPCLEGEGDCDSDIDCAGSLVCPPDGRGTEYCEQPGNGGGGGGPVLGSGNLRVLTGNGTWVSVSCDSGEPRADGGNDIWRTSGRKLLNQDDVYLYCPESYRDGDDCRCSSSRSERFHAIAHDDFNVDASDRRYPNSLGSRVTERGPMWIFPNSGHEYCLSVGRNNNVIETVDGGDDRNHHESTHQGRCNEWCLAGGCP